ncbi:MAG: hypothetical protein A3C06_01880 [Candidatus Taylorbacteria bacterium RIFCSPHIGHO2_02_FULL_46_13]|uniref:Phosphatidic acid phosphatase type 2/haloperoxidase domain-containing protein n=1 Tax=Candidatus Taylorbacteria bacterium RIFCSPHIGHO2_02_FULL_46_13 TaxID=1802312 RepID=A0A1G2MQ16_9BACT|nr:MAG: hypothetical protein A3C06_01880 [Candidatus Taylorbacteria bacterium RIFCSPHIGHO2_02_FULL_46_13]
MQTTTAKRLIYGGLLGIIASVLLGLFVIHPENFLQSIDLSLYQTLYPPSSTSLITLMLCITAFGSATVVTVLSLIALGVLSIRRWWFEVIVWVSALGATELFTFILKNIILRARPLVHLVEASGGSYPSGHATSATVLYILVFLFLVPLLRHKTARSLCSLCCFVLIATVALSRLILGAHWLSDIVGSMLLAGGTTLFCYGIAQLIKQKTIT